MYFIGPENNKMIILAFVHLANKTRVLEASVKSGRAKELKDGLASCCGKITETLLSGNTTEVETLKRLHP